MHEDYNSSELDCYFKIINGYLERKDSPEKTEIWKNQAIISLMGKLEDKNNKTLVQNALILLLNLFGNMPADPINNKGQDIKGLSNTDKEQILANLRLEFIPN